MLATACAQAIQWGASGHSIGVSVNVSARQLCDERFVDEAIRILAAAGIDPTYLVPEVSETTIMDNLDAAKVQLRRLKSAGIGIAVDNFGTAYSSLGQLSTLPIDAIKIDRSLIFAIASNTGIRALVHTLVELGHALGMQALAEGVEVAAQEGQVRAEAFDDAQGRLFAAPLRATDLADLLANETNDGPHSVQAQAARHAERTHSEPSRSYP